MASSLFWRKTTGMKFQNTVLAGWAQNPRLMCKTFRPERVKAVVQILDSQNNTVIARGLGRSHGDSSLQENGTVLMERLNKFLSFDSKTGILKAQAGVTLIDVLETFLHQGWVPAVMPGTKFVTLGGCVASDVHGKDCANGTFGKWVEELVISTGKGRISCSRKENADLFTATIGGMGLTGVIEEVTLKLQKVGSSYVNVSCQSFCDIQQVLALFEQNKGENDFMAAWIDAMAGGKSVGRGWFQTANWSNDAQLEGFNREDDLKPIGKIFDLGAKFLPAPLFKLGLNRFGLKLLNALIYWNARSFGGFQGRMLLPTFMFPLDKYPNWYRMYGKSGFYQFQCVIPQDMVAEVIPEILAKTSASGAGSFFSTLKLFEHKEEQGDMSFPMEGMTLAMDFPNAGAKTQKLLIELADMVAGAGGRVYLTKDALLTKKQFSTMYPQYKDFLKTKKAWDPQNQFWSAQAERVMGGR